MFMDRGAVERVAGRCVNSIVVDMSEELVCDCCLACDDGGLREFVQYYPTTLR